MDVHRSRFVPYPLTPITAAAFSRSSDYGQQVRQPRPALKLAIGRQDGSIEIWNPLHGHWVQEAVFPGDGRSLDGLAWTRESDELDTNGQVVLGQHRLFSIASSPAVIEWDLERGQPKRRSTGNFSEVWCFAPQPRQEQTSGETGQSQDIVAGCGDGTIVLLSTADNDVQFKRFVARVSGKKAKCVSIAYQTRDRVVAGFMDGTIRIFDTRNGQNVRTMSLGAGLPNATKNVIVWQVRTLANGDIVSGDSNGEVVFWDGRSHTLSQRIKAHDSECLDLVVSGDGKTVFSGSMNGRLAVLRQSTTAGGRRSWGKTHHRRIHERQLKAMSAFDSDGFSMVVSGGDDLVPMVTPLREYGKEHNRSLPTLPQHSPLRSARHARLLVSWWDKTISIWRLARRSQLDPTIDNAQPSRKLVARLSLEVKNHIRDVAISDDGRALAAATSSEVKVFQLRRPPDTDGLSVRRLEVPRALASSGARVLRFSADNKWLAAVRFDNDVQIVRLAAVPAKPKYLHILDKVVELERREHEDGAQSVFRQFEKTVAQLDFAPDSSVLACGDMSGHIDSWVLAGHEDPTAPAVDISKHDSPNGDSDDNSDSSDEDDEICIFYGQHWTDNPAGKLLPKLESVPLVFSFRPSPSQTSNAGLVNGNPGIHSTRHHPHAHSHELPKGPHLLWVMTAQHNMYEIDVLQGRLSDWSRRNPSSVLPADFTNLTERVKGAVWDVSAHRQRLWLFSSSWVFMLTVGTDLAARPSSRKRRKAEAERAERAKRLRTSSGAGVKKPLSHRVALPDTVHRYEDGEWVDQAVDRPRAAAAAAAADDEEDGDDVDEDGEEEGEDQEEAESRLRLTRMPPPDGSHPQQQPHQSRDLPWWYTLKYRSILGIVPLADDASSLGDGGVVDKPLEVVLVERPLWDVKA